MRNQNYITNKKIIEEVKKNQKDYVEPEPEVPPVEPEIPPVEPETPPVDPEVGQGGDEDNDDEGPTVNGPTLEDSDIGDLGDEEDEEGPTGTGPTLEEHEIGDLD